MMLVTFEMQTSPKRTNSEDDGFIFGMWCICSVLRSASVVIKVDVVALESKWPACPLRRSWVLSFLSPLRLRY